MTKKDDLLAAKRIAAPVWQRGEERKRLIVLARQLYHAGLIPHDIDELLARLEQPMNPFEMMVMGGLGGLGRHRPTPDNINWEALEKVVWRYFPDERPGPVRSKYPTVGGDDE